MGTLIVAILLAAAVGLALRSFKTRAGGCGCDRCGAREQCGIRGRKTEQ